MKKNTKRVASLKAEQVAKNKVVKAVTDNLTSNTISEETRAYAETIIAEKEAEIAAIREEMERLEAEEEDHSEELLARIAELSKRVEEIAEEAIPAQNFIKVQNFIQSKDGEKAFMDVVRNSTNSKEFKANWRAKLVSNGITPEDVMLPPAVLGEVNDAWERSAENFLSYLDITGLRAMKVLTDVSDPNAETSRAAGHKKGTEKQEQVLNLVPKEIRAQFVYKYITIDRETVEYEDETGALMRYIARELADRVIHEIMRAVLIGDGRATGANNKINKIEAITAAGAAYTTTITSAAATPTIDEVADAVDSISAPGDVILAISKPALRTLRRYVAASGGTSQYITMEELADQLGVREIFVTDILDDTAAGSASVIAFVGKAYKVVGDLTMRGFENFILGFNKNEYLTEVYIGGALAVPLSASVVVRP